MQYLFLCSIIIMPNITYSAVSTTLIGLSHMPIFYSIEMYLTGLFPLWLQLQIFGGRSLLGCHDWIQIFFFLIKTCLFIHCSYGNSDFYLFFYPFLAKPFYPLLVWMEIHWKSAIFKYCYRFFFSKFINDFLLITLWYNPLCGGSLQNLYACFRTLFAFLTTS